MVGGLECEGHGADQGCDRQSLIALGKFVMMAEFPPIHVLCAFSPQKSFLTDRETKFNSVGWRNKCSTH
jgi:hypothetical protein